jgi:hypothetical protein
MGSFAHGQPTHRQAIAAHPRPDKGLGFACAVAGAKVHPGDGTHSLRSDKGCDSTVEELSALFVYANMRSNADTGTGYALVAPTKVSRYPGGLHGWGGGSRYWSLTFAGKRLHKVIDLSNRRVGADHDVHRNYVSCAR